MPESAVEPIETRTNLMYEEFVQSYLLPNKPIVLRGAASNWGAMGKWTPDYFKETQGNTTVVIDDRPYSVREFVDLLHASTESRPAPYLRNQDIATVFPELLCDVTPVPEYMRPNWLHDSYFPPKLHHKIRALSVIEVYIGGPGAKFPVIHFDSYYTHAYLTQIYGRKELLLWSPDQSRSMYATRRNNISDVNDAIEPDLARFPLFARARAVSTLIEPGDTAFIPSGWWHTARMLTESITVSVNVANDSNWSNVARDIADEQNRLIAPALRAYIELLGRVKKATAAGAK